PIWRRRARRGAADLDRCDRGALRRPALRREPAPAGSAVRGRDRRGRAGRGAAAARQGDELQQLRRRRRRLARRARPRRAAHGGDHQARQPVRDRGRETVVQAHARAHACDPVSAFGGVIATNATVDAAMSAQVKDVFTEVVVAPAFEPEAVEILTQKKNIRLLEVSTPPAAALEQRRISGGLLVQQVDRIDAPGDDPAAWTLAAGEPADEATLADLAFAWR